MVSLFVGGKAEEDGPGVHGASPDYSVGHFLRKDLALSTNGIGRLCSASHTSIPGVRCYLMRTYAPGSLQTDQRRQPFPRKTLVGTGRVAW